MITTLNENAKEGSTYTIEITFKDEEGNLCVPNELTYTLSDTYGNIINSKENISIIINSVINITLYGYDLIPGRNILTIKGTYDSTYGDNLPLRDAVTFFVDDILMEE